jgi:lipopolysaccharide heptosyltransferase II
LKIFILKPSSLGDVIQALPVLRLIKLRHPASEIFWWLDAGLVSLLEGDPDLAGIIPFERRRWSSPLNWGEVWSSLRRMRALRFDWVIDLQSLARSGLCAWLSNGGFTVGLADGREGAPALYDVCVPRPSPLTHAVDWYLQVLPVLGVPADREFVWLPERPEVATAVREKWDLRGERWVVIQPGARWENKRWPAAHFAEAANICAAQFPEVRFAILGSANESGLAGTISRAIPGRCLNLAGGLSLLEMVEWVRLCDVMVTNDTGPMHVAAALGKPVVALFGPTEPRRTGPYGQIDRSLRFAVPCAPCMKSECTSVRLLECLEGITPRLVAQRMMEALKTPAGRAGE